jgi:hypothetical protein
MSKRTILLVAALFALAAGGAAAADRVKGPFAGTVHAVGTLSDRSGGPIDVTWDRGLISSLSGTSITLTRRDQAQVTFAITGDTAVRNGGASYHLSDLGTGLVATVISQNGDAVVIRRIRGDGAPSGGDQSVYEGPAAKAVTGSVDAQYADGSHRQFDYDRGLITAVGNGRLTLVRADGESVTLAYDASTLVREQGGETGSVDDLEAGERAMFFSQAGALKLVRCVRGAQASAARGPRRGPAALGAAAR